MSQVERTNLLEGQSLFIKQTFKNTINEFGINTDGDLRFDECVFESSVSFDNFRIGGKLTFFNCKFSSYSIIKNSYIEIISISACEFPSTEKSLFILKSNKCGALSLSSFNGYEIKINGTYQLMFISDCHNNKLTIKDVNNEYTSNESKIEFKFENLIEKLDIQCSDLNSKIIFNKGTYNSINLEGNFRENIDFKESINVENLYLESSIFYKRIDIEGGNFKYIYFYRSQFYGLIWFNGYNLLEKTYKNLAIDDLTFHECTFEKNVSVNVLKINNFSISNNNFKQILDFNQSNEKKDWDLHLNVSINGTNQGNIIFGNSYLDISLGGINFGNLTFKDVNISHLYINELQNKGVVSFMNIISGDYLIISNSIIGNADFTGSDITLFKEFVFADSNLNGINFSKHPFKIISYSTNPVHGYGIQDKSRWNNNLKNVYNQLKKNASNKGDIDTALKYQSLEYKYLFKEKRIGFDKALLFLNMVSNNNGLSWSRGVLFTLVTAYLFLVIYLRTINVEFSVKDSIKDYIFFLSSFPKLEIEKYTAIPSSWKSSLVIWLSRIFISYGIYQTIAAFRKYGKN